MAHEEIEVKFLVEDLAALRQRVLALGAKLERPRTYEYNVRFDTPEHRLQQQGCLLRVRRDTQNTLTYKEPPATAEQDFKFRYEYEVMVSDFSQMCTILARLGFVPTWRYEKYRETFTYADAKILLDELPFGTFVEIEGSRESIRTIAAQLGLDFATRITASYGEIFETIRTTYRLSVPDLTFENFRGLALDLRACHLG